MTNSASPPIACTLSAGDFQDRVGWMRELSARSLRSHRRNGLMLDRDIDGEKLLGLGEFERAEPS